MDFSWFYKFMVLLWKNFVLKRRRFIALIMEIILTLLFIGTLLLTRNFVVIRNYGPFNYSLQPVDELPAFLGNIPFPGLWELAFVPSKSVVVKNIVETVKRDLHYNFKVQGFSSERDFENYVKKKVNSKKVMAAFVFDHEFQNSHDPLPLKVKYHLRFSSFQRNKDVRFDRNRGWETGALFPAFPSVGPRNEDFENGGSPGYITEGFLVMQHALDKAIMAYHARVAVQNLFTNVTVFVQRFPYPEYYHDFFLEMLDIFTPLVILFIFAMNHLILVQSIVWEKENRLKVTPLSWCCTTINIIKILQLLKIFYIEPVPVIQHSDPSLVFVFLLCYAIATICFSFMVSTFFNKVYFSVSVGGFIYLATYFPATSFFSNYAQMTLTQKLASCFSSNIAMSLGTKFLVKAEMDKIGIKWSNIFSPTKLDNFVFAYILGMFLFDAFLYGLVAWYIEAVFPGEYGVSKPWNFFLLHSHWCGEAIEKTNETRQFYETTKSKYFEAEPPDLVAGIQIKHMCKEFRVKNTIKTAVKDLSLNLFEGQITVLVGHNGAGKSTTLSILSGLYLLTSGEAYVNGYDVSKQMGQIRKSLGLCPQQDLLFNYLTVSEHLYFYSVIKGIPQKMRLIEINNMLSTFNLLEKHNAFSVSLSGGMKRKLSIIIALIGGSKVVILDEPTSGMDPASRRATWNLLQHYKQDRTILLTTHDMDEADLLGDRIAIMVNGSLRCCGSSIFLKKIYGVGYHIDIVKEPHCDVEEIAKIIYYHIPIATLEKNARNELSFILPKDYTHRFETLFTDLEKRRKELGIASFGASITTMEEVFLSGHQMALNVHFGMALLISSFCLQTVTERVSKAKHIQFVSGVYVLVYWLSALLWDFTIFFITCCLLLVMFKYGRLDIYITDYRFLDTMLIFLLYGWSAIPLMYLLSFLFTRSTSAYIILVLFNYLSGIFTLLIDDSFQLGLIHGVNFLQKKMSFFFPFSDNTKNVYSLEEETIGKYMIMMSITGFVFLLIIFFLETTLWRLRTFFHQYIYFVIYKAFKKVYFKYPVIFAVKNISLAIQKGECFGLLGFNGAGKTTTFKLLTGDEIVTSGKVFIDGFSITENTQKVKSRIGYCPQSDALLEYMTGREIMIMYARLWGISEPQIQQYVDKWLNSLQLEPHADKLISTYSGGNKRQLSTAIALMGKPSVILLDEPTTGMDPVAQRLLWDAVTWARESGKAIVISSHRMEECDAFCTRLAIMVQGKFMCLGNPQHLKSKFGNIYILNIKAKIYTHEDKLDDLKFFITMTFPGSVLKHENQGILHYYIPSKDNTWGKVFGILEEAKEQYNLEDYSISQITLEQVFLTFANPTELRKRVP
uniref:ABC transporter domain-containing protein n=1 Tax=Sus scrofa TaxID=9823 RepID=A0A8D1IGB3_PIG